MLEKHQIPLATLQLEASDLTKDLGLAYSYSPIYAIYPLMQAPNLLFRVILK